MAEPISIQQLKDASEDAITLADFIYKPANVMIPRRLAADINSLQYYLDYMSSYAQHSYETYDEMVANAVNLSENVSVFVTNDLDAAKNGIYTYNGTSFVRGDYQPENVAKDYVEAKLGGLEVFEGKVRAQDVSTADGSTQDVKNTEFRSELDALPFEGGVLADTFVTVEEQITGEGAVNQRELNQNTIMVVDSITTLLKVKVREGRAVYVKGIQKGLFVYDASQSTVNDGGTVLNGWVRQVVNNTVSPEMFGATGKASDDQTEALQRCFANKKYKIEGQGDYVFTEDLSVYTDISIGGTLITRPKATGRIPTLYVKPIGDAYVEIDKTPLKNLTALSTDIGVPIEYAGNYISIITNEVTPRFMDTDSTMGSYPINYAGVVTQYRGVTEVLPRLPIGLNKALISSVRIHYKQKPLELKLASLYVDASVYSPALAGKPLGGDVVRIDRDSTSCTLGSFSQSHPNDATRGVEVVYNVRANGCSIKQGDLSHFNGTGLTTIENGNSYGILLSLSCNTNISGVKGISNWSTVAAANAYSVVVRDCLLTSAGDHFGADWTIDNCTVGTSYHAGADIKYTNTTITVGLSAHSDMGWNRGHCKISNCVWDTTIDNSFFRSTARHGKFNRVVAEYDEIIIDGLTVLNKARQTYRVLVNLYKTEFSIINKDNGWGELLRELPKIVKISNVTILDPTNRLVGVSLTGGKSYVSRDNSVHSLKVVCDNVHSSGKRISSLIGQATHQHGEDVPEFQPVGIDISAADADTQALVALYPSTFSFISSASEVKWCVDLNASNFSNVITQGAGDYRFINTASFNTCGGINLYGGASVFAAGSGTVTTPFFKAAYRLVNCKLYHTAGASGLVTKNFDLINCHFPITDVSAPWGVNTNAKPTSLIGCTWGVGVTYEGGAKAYWVDTTKYSAVTP